jgi:hypothetical protein
MRQDQAFWLLALAGLGALLVAATRGSGAARYRATREPHTGQEPQHAPHAHGAMHDPVHDPVRSAGPAEMRDPPARWSMADEASDESFPASDPPATW